MRSAERGSRCCAWIALAILQCLAGCQTAPPAPELYSVDQELIHRFGNSMPVQTVPGEIVMPPGASLDHEITEDEAISIALWNNAAFQELLVDLGIARGDLIQAGLLPNPDFIYFFGNTDKAFKYLFDFPIESVWLRPIRVKAAAREADRVADKLAQGGLDLIRDVRQGYADVLLAIGRVRVAREGVKLRGRVAELAEIRLKNGDISPQEAATARIDSFQAQQDLARIEYEIPVAEEKLRNLLGIGPIRTELKLDPYPPPAYLKVEPNELADEAMANRPDALAAAEFTAAARARLKFAKVGWVKFLGILDGTSGRVAGHELGPGFRVTIPIFNQNQGNIARAEAELEKAVRNQQTVSYQIILDVQRTYLQYSQACAELKVLREKVRPEVEAAISRAQAAYQEGNVTIFIVLETTRQLLDTHLIEAKLNADLRRFWAELERSVGRRLIDKSRLEEFPDTEKQRFETELLPPPRPNAVPEENKKPESAEERKPS